MPAAALEASAPGTERSSTSTLRPACARRKATAQPCTPAPMTMMSDFIEREAISAAGVPLWGQRQLHAELRPALRVGMGERYGSAVRLGDGAGDEQAQPRSALPRPLRPRSAVERVEEVRPRL